MIRLIPGDAVAIMLGANTEVTPERIAELRGRVGLDRPIVEQYLAWAGAALRGDLGTSLWTGRPVAGEIVAHLWPTLELTFLALLVGAGLAVPVGCLMAQSRGGAADVALRVGAIAGLTIPSFWLGIVLILLLAQLAPRLRVARLRAVLRGPARQPAAHDAAGASRWRCRSSPTCRASCARRCSTRSARTTSAPRAPRALSERARRLQACAAQRADPLRHQRRHHDRLSARRRDRGRAGLRHSRASGG